MTGARNAISGAWFPLLPTFDRGVLCSGRTEPGNHTRVSFAKPLRKEKEESMVSKRLVFIVLASMLALSACSASVTTGYPDHYGYYDQYGRWHRY
jgi:hypothetical protein